MNEMQKTGIFAGAALLLAVGAGLVVYSQSLPEADPVRATAGMPFFPDFTDPLAARSLEIVSWDQEKSQPRVFQVSQVNGLWSLPSKDNYPADAERQLAEAASNLINRKKERLVDSDAQHHADYGLLDPQPEGGAPPAPADDPAAFGVRVVVRDGGNNVLAQFIVGKEDKDDPTRRYVRVPGQDLVYATEIRIDRLSTRFEDWIEKDLLRLNPFDLAAVTIVDYSVDIEQGVQDMRSRIALAHDAAKSEWQLEELLAFQEGEGVPVAMQPDEELATDTLNALKTALDELRIVDVERQPPVGGGQQQIAVLQALGERGFYPVQVQGGIAIVSNEGEIVVTLKDGVEYRLRFGEIAVGTEQSAAEQADAAAGAATPDTSSTNRYLLVNVAFNEEAIPKPELKPLPGDHAPPAEEAAGETPVEDAAAPAGSGDEPTPEGDATEPADDAAEPAADAATDEEPAAPPASDEAGASEGGGGQDPAAAAATDDAAADAAQPVADAAQPPADPAQPAADGEPAPAADQPAGLTPEQQAERLRIQAENESAQEAYEKKIEDGQRRVEELQLRFQDWFFVISNATYEKIHLGRAQIVREKTVPPGDGDTLDDFDALREQGPQGAPAPAPAPPGGGLPPGLPPGLPMF